MKKHRNGLDMWLLRCIYNNRLVGEAYQLKPKPTKKRMRLSFRKSV